MGLNNKKYIITYYIVMLLLGIYNFIVHFINPNFVENYETYLVTGFTLFNYFISFISFLMFIGSIILIFIVYKNKLSKLDLIVPIFYVFYYLIWSFIITLFVGIQFANTQDSLTAINNLAKFDIIFFIFQIIISGYYVHNLVKK